MSSIRRSRPEDLPSARAAVADLLAADAPVALFLDYDGTLTPIVKRPEDAALAPEMRSAVVALTRACAIVAVVSGRDRADVEKLVGMEEIGYVGSHGFDIAVPQVTVRGGRSGELRLEVGADHLAELDSAEAELHERLDGIDGAQVERKRFALAAHYRRVAASLKGRVSAVVDEIGARHPSLRRAEGLEVVELRPDLDWSKGRAVAWILAELGLERATALHLGDDLTDEAVFAALAERSTGRGVGVLVGKPERETAATHRLDDPADVLAFLRELASGLEGRGVR